MKLFTNSENSTSLKILIAANFSNIGVDVEIVTVDDSRFQKPPRLPVLETDSGEQIFSTNSAANLLYPSKPNLSSDVNYWLEWEAVQLQATLIRSIGTKFENQDLIKQLTLLDSELSKHTFVIKGSNVTVCDISIWSALYPLFTDSNLVKVFSSKFSNITKWFNNLHGMQQFKESLSKFNIGQGVQCLQSIAASSFYPAGVIQESPDLSPVSDCLTAASSVSDISVKEPITAAELKSVENAWNNSVPVTPKSVTNPILPNPGERNVFITSALPYVNNVPHLGNIIGCVLSADVYARYCRSRNWNTLYICGTDEYGTATETKAIEEGLTPREICDKYYKMHKETYEWFNISFDHFGRTSTPQQTQIVQELFLLCHKNGFTSTQEMDQLLCEKCDRYLADRFVEGICPRCGFEDARGDQCDGCGHLINATELIKPKCKVCKSTPVVRQSKHFFLELPKLEANINKWLNTVVDGWSHNAQVITKSWLKDGLKARCITRDLKWGIPVPLPGYEKKVFYVWFDACIGYMSLTNCYTDQWKAWWEYSDDKPVTYYQFMAKDNVPFHSIMFPSTLIASGRKYNMVKHLMATEYLNYEDGKFSKSRGVGVFGTDAKETGLSSDIFRFYLLYVRPEGQDSTFSWADLALKNNTELLNNLGNFINRALMFVEKFFDSVIPELHLNSDDYKLLAYITREVKSYISALDKAKLRDGIKYFLAVAKHGNYYMQSAKPWVLVKGTPEEKKRAGTVVGLSCNISCLLAILLKPYMPQTVEVITQQLNVSPELFVLNQEIPVYLKPGHKIGKPAPLFSKIEQSSVEEFKERFAGKQQDRGAVNNKSKKKGKAVQNEVVNEVVSSDPQILKLQEAIAKQGDLVREMKKSGVPKTEWQPQVNILLQMKSQLEDMKLSMPSLEQLQDKVAKQGNKVREMKTSGLPKSKWQPEVAVLLQLKQQLELAQKSAAEKK